MPSKPTATDRVLLPWVEAEEIPRPPTIWWETYGHLVPKMFNGLCPACGIDACYFGVAEEWTHTCASCGTKYNVRRKP